MSNSITVKPKVIKSTTSRTQRFLEIIPFCKTTSHTAIKKANPCLNLPRIFDGTRNFYSSWFKTFLVTKQLPPTHVACYWPSEKQLLSLLTRFFFLRELVHLGCMKQLLDLNNRFSDYPQQFVSRTNQVCVTTTWNVNFYRLCTKLSFCFRKPSQIYTKPTSIMTQLPSVHKASRTLLKA